MFLSIKEAARRINRDIVVVQISDDESDEQNDVLKSKDCGDKHNYLGRILQTLNIRLKNTTPFLEIQVRICSFLSRCIFFNTSSHVTVEV